MTPYEEYLTTLRGWRDGAAGKQPDAKLEQHANEYIKAAYFSGFRTGSTVLAEFRADLWVKTGFKPSILREESEV